MNKEKAVYKLNIDCGRSGTLTGLFIAKKNHVKILIENSLCVDFGEVLGKHSEIFGTVDKNEIKFVSDTNEVIDIIEEFELETGCNPFDYTAINMKREDLEDLTVLEVVKILEKEQV
jgi:hypothetical protein